MSEDARFIWTDDQIARLRVLWDEGHSTAAIGRHLGVSKNSIVGKAHRIDLPERPSPIVRNGERQRPGVQRHYHTQTLPPLASLATVTPIILAPRKPKPPATAPTQPTPAPRKLPSKPCCWPIGEPGTKAFRFCGADSEPGKPHCSEHTKRAYVKVRDLRDEAA